MVALLLCHFTLATPYLGDALSWRRPAVAVLALGVAPPGRRLMLTLTLTLSTPGYGTVHRQSKRMVKVASKPESK